MSSKQHRTAGVDYVEIDIDGQKYKLRPLTLGLYAEMESYIVAQRGDPLGEAAKACERVPEKYHAAIWDAAMRQAVQGRTVTAEEAATFENSIRGLAWKLWKCLERDQPDVDSVDAALAILTKLGPARLEEINYKVQLASGEADLGKSSGQQPTEKATAKDPGGKDPAGQ